MPGLQGASPKKILPPVIENQVKNGEAKIDFRNFTIIGEQSMPAGAAALAAGEQGRGWNFVELFYRNQGAEDSGYADDEFLDRDRQGRRRPGHRQLEQRTQEPSVTAEVEATTAEAAAARLHRHAVVRGRRPGDATAWNRSERRSTGDLEAAIEAAR